MNYKIRLPIGPPQFGEFQKDDYGPNECGCDGFMYVNILWPEEGFVGMSVVFQGMDGRTRKPLSDKERFKILFFLAHDLLEHGDLDAGRKSLCKAVVESYRVMFKPKGEHGDRDNTATEP